MTIKLPIILSAMLAALAIPGTTLASEAPAPDAAPADAAAPAPEAAAAPAEAAAPEQAPAAEKKPAKKKAKKKKHHRHHAHGGGVRGAAPADPNDRLPYDERRGSSNDAGCSGSSDDSHHAGEMEVPGQKTP